MGSSDDFFSDLNGNLDTMFDGGFSLGDDSPASAAVQPVIQDNRRTSRDFNPDMDTLLISAQAPFINEAWNYFAAADFSERTVHAFNEAMSGMTLLIKIIERSPDNYNKLQMLLNTDEECMGIEEKAFGMFMKKHKRLPGSNSERIFAFTMMQSLFRSGYIRSSIAAEQRFLDKFCTLRGGVNPDMVKRTFITAKEQCGVLAKSLQKILPHAMNIAEKGLFVTGDHAKEKKMYCTFIVNGASYLYQYYNEAGVLDECKKYMRIHDLWVKTIKVHH